ncbi:MAG: tRNA pseudouridine synthase A [Bacillota bacterium]|nr:tRNA pseudouridine synthase A [Bacillota bacterium]
MRPYLLVVSYWGRPFHGFQMQRAAQPTVQGHLERALSHIEGRPVRIRAAGRTDTGVHAAAMPVRIDISREMSRRKWLLALHGLLPQEIQIRDIQEIPADFDPRFDALRKTYVYCLWLGERTPFWAPYATPWPFPLDEENLAKTLFLLEGTRDFRAFARAHGKRGRTLRSLTAHWGRKGQLVALYFASDGFLYRMVRSLAAAVLAVQRGRLSLDDLSAYLDPKGPSFPWTAPSQGLTLLQVDYPDRVIADLAFRTTFLPRPAIQDV